MKKYLFLVALISLAELALAQQEQKKKNLQRYSPSVLLGKGDWELKLFNNLYTQTKSFDAQGKKVENDRRETYYTLINQFLIGINKSINVGADVWVKSVNSNPMGGSAFEVFQIQESEQRRSGVTGIGPKIKIAPIKSQPYFSWQSIFLIPVAKDLEGIALDSKNPFLFLEWDRYLWMNQFFYDRKLGDKFQIFLQLAFWYSIVRDSSREKNFLETPASVFFSYFPTTRISFYFMTEYWPKHHQEPFFAYFIQSGLGGKYQIIPGLMELELLYTNFWIGSEGEGAGQTFNLGLRFIH